MLCRHFEPDLSEISIHEDCGLLAWSPLCRVIISGKYLDGARPENARLTIETRIEHRVGSQIDAAVRKYMELAHCYNLDVCQMAIAFVAGKNFVSSTLIGATNMEQLKTNIDSISLKLPTELCDKIENLRREYPMLY